MHETFLFAANGRAESMQLPAGADVR
jgi:hypothetical protein